MSGRRYIELGLLRRPGVRQAPAGGTVETGGTPLDLYPSIMLEDIVWDDYEQPEAPVTSGSPIASTWETLAADATANPGKILTLADNQPSVGAGSLPELTDCSNVEIQLANNVTTVQGMEFGTDADHVRVRAMGPNVVLSHVRIAGNASHIVIDSCMMPGSDAGSAIEVQGGASRPHSIAFIRCVASAVDFSSGAMCGLLAECDDILFAKCNLGNSTFAASNNWTVRFNDVDRVVVADCYGETVTTQQVFRRNLGNSYSYFNCTTIARSSGRSIADIGGGGSEADITECYLYDCTHFIAGATNTHGPSLNPSSVSHIFHITNGHYHVGASNPFTLAGLAALEASEPATDEWQLVLGSPTETSWDASHPGWQTINDWQGNPLTTSDPYAL